MAKFQLVIVQSIEGCMVENYQEQYPVLYREASKLKERATFPMDENASLSMLIDGKKRKDYYDATYFIEATPVTESIINGMLRMYLINEIIVYTIPVMLYTGRRLFQSELAKTDWKCTDTKVLKDGSVRTVFRKQEK